MINLDSYIVEKLKLDKDTKVDNTTPDIIAEKIYDELSKEQYKMSFPSKVQKNKHDACLYIYPILSDKLKYYKDEILECFKGIDINECNIFRIAISNNGNLYFSNRTRWSQGEVMYYNNNPDFVYFILNKDDKCELCGHERRFYGQPNSIGRIYKFSIEL